MRRIKVTSWQLHDNIIDEPAGRDRRLELKCNLSALIDLD
jgi:hypothetical protein